jgi:hypothetical protein
MHVDELKRLREALDLLPRDSTQHHVVAARVLELSRALDREPQAPSNLSSPSSSSLTKAKLLGLSKASTFFSMLLSAGVYWSICGWSAVPGVAR